jgi:hypothetical protein
MFESIARIEEHEEDFNCHGEMDIFSDKNVPLIWKDPESGLIWEFKNSKNYEDLYTYREAESYVDKLNSSMYGGSFHWRIPTIDELLSLGSAKLFDYRAKNMSYNSRISWSKKIERFRNGRTFVKKPISGFMNHQVDSWYWSATESNNFKTKMESSELEVSRDAQKVWVVSFFEGGNYHNGKEQKNSLICVRSR